MVAGAETTAFAARLRELKEGSGLSYGVLAKRLHMSASTLHRYCNGDAVPTEFAPVDRLARLCKAGPEQLVEIHRLWIVADAAKVRERPGVRPSTPETAPGGDGDSASDSGAGSAPDGGGDRDAAPEADPLFEPPASPDSVDAPARRRRRTVLAAALAVVLLTAGGVTVASLAGNGDGGGDTRNTAAGSAAQDSDARSSSSGASSRSGSPSPGHSPSPSKPKGATPSASAPGAGGGTGKKEDGGAGAGAVNPLSVNVRPYSWEDPCSPLYLIQDGPDEVPPAPAEADAPTWVRAQGAVSAGSQRVALTVQGTGHGTVVLQAIHVRVQRSGAALPWNAYRMGNGCGGGVPTNTFDVNLDVGTPNVKPLSGQRDFPYKVSENDPEVFYVTGHAQSHDVTWYLDLDWSSGDQHGTLRIDDNGQPFRTSGAEGRPEWVWPPGGDKWTKPDEL